MSVILVFKVFRLKDIQICPKASHFIGLLFRNKTNFFSKSNLSDEWRMRRTSSNILFKLLQLSSLRGDFGQSHFESDRFTYGGRFIKCRQVTHAKSEGSWKLRDYIHLNSVVSERFDLFLTRSIFNFSVSLWHHI